MTHTEKVHVMLGSAAALAGALALWEVYRPNSRARLCWPVLAFLIGLFLFIPVEARSRTYQDLGWWEVLLSAVPEHPTTWIRDWFYYLPQRHVIQHKIGALCIMAIGLIEFRRAQGGLPGRAAGLALPALLLGTGIAFGVHGGTAAHLSHSVEQIHHQVLGVAFAAAAATLSLSRTGRLRAHFWKGLWAALVLAVGLDIAVLYRLRPTENDKEIHHHESAGPGMR
jgi:hypothetical protein